MRDTARECRPDMPGVECGRGSLAREGPVLGVSPRREHCGVPFHAEQLIRQRWLQCLVQLIPIAKNQAGQMCIHHHHHLHAGDKFKRNCGCSARPLKV